MRVRDHIVISTACAALLAPRLGRDMLVPLTAAIVIDADHYLWFCLRQSPNPLAAVEFFNEAQPPRHEATRLLHSPPVAAVLLMLGLRHRNMRPALAGMALHIGLDAFHEMRLRRARRAALQRDDWTCSVCGRQSSDVIAHLARQPWLLPSYGIENLVSLCGACHENAHRCRAPAKHGWAMSVS